MAIGRAYGKVILLGEHAVVYGAPALAVGIDKGARASVVDHANGSGVDATQSQLEIEGWIAASEHDASELGRAFRAVLNSTRAERAVGNVRVIASAELPPGGGLGCSAALGVAIARALDEGASDSLIEARAMEWERVFHGNPSGIDAAVSARGGALLFRRGFPAIAIPIAPHDANMAKPLVLCVAFSGRSSSTKAMVEAVARRRAEARDEIDSMFMRIGELVESARHALEVGEWKRLGALMNQNQSELERLSLATEATDSLVRRAREVGALGAKITGAGGGGSVVAIADDEAVASAIVEAWSQANFACFASSVRTVPAAAARSSEIGVRA